MCQSVTIFGILGHGVFDESLFGVQQLVQYSTKGLRERVLILVLEEEIADSGCRCFLGKPLLD